MFVTMDIRDHILGIEGPDGPMQGFIAYLRKGDERCRFKIGDRVVKTAQLDNNEIHPIGSKGTVTGSIYVDHPNAPDKEAYLVVWDQSRLETTTVGRRLEKLLES